MMMPRYAMPPFSRAAAAGYAAADAAATLALFLADFRHDAAAASAITPLSLFTPAFIVTLLCPLILLLLMS